MRTPTDNESRSGFFETQPGCGLVSSEEGADGLNGGLRGFELFGDDAVAHAVFVEPSDLFDFVICKLSSGVILAHPETSIIYRDLLDHRSPNGQ